jgi:hypothetical protein
MVIKIVGVLLVVLLMLLTLRVSRARTLRRRQSDAGSPLPAADHGGHGSSHGVMGHH